MDLPTPCLLLDPTVLARNIDAMSERTRHLGVQLRAHMKTSKSAEVMARLPRAPGASAPSIAVSTLREAEYLFDAGARDILHAIPLAPAKHARARALVARGARLGLLVDTPQALEQLISSAPASGEDLPLRVMLEIDSDGYRGGLAPEAPALMECAALLRTAPQAVSLGGVYGYAGRTYTASDATQGAQIVERCRRATLAATEQLRSAGLTVESVCLGGSPVAVFAEQLEGVDTLCAGVWMFNDLFQHGLGICALEDLAVSVLATVVSANTATDTVFIDAGALALSQDRSTAEQSRDTAYGLLADAATGRLLPGYRVTAVSQEHGHVTGPQVLARLPVGTQVRVLPNHVCMSAAGFEGYVVIGDDPRNTDYWPRVNGW
ncbi:MAG: alanine racemase [Pseudomonadota bacterium]